VSDTTLSSTYDPSGIEAPIYRRWEERGHFHVDAADARRPWSVVIPPPNVTAELHMGHGLNNTLQDVLARWRRMDGHDVLWVPGTDHAGIATQNVVERQLASQGTDRWELGREAFEDRVWEWVDDYGGRIIKQLKTIGCTCDWDRTRFTLDEGLSRAVREVFVRLHEKGLVYRGNYIINWCPRCGTALSDEEVEHHERQGKLYHIRYPFAGEGGGEEGGDGIVVATTRPETMLGDTAIAVNPDDERWTHLVGRTVVLPLVGRELPVVADEFVDPEFGTGLVKVTPAHDPNDFEIGRRHDLETVNVMTEDATIGEGAPERYRGLDRYEARERVVEDLRAEGRLVEVEDHAHSVGQCYRCDTVVEPRLSLQWFVKMEPLAEPALEAYREGELRFHPERYGKIYEHWMENIRDWCISRQLWWGHRIPVWYCRDEACEETIVAREAPEVCPECGGRDLEQDPDVLDTWFSSWLWPFSTMGWPEETGDLEVFYPTDTLVTGADILFFWVARMVMAGLEFTGELPFTDVVLNGMVRDHRGRTMSKSLGNGIDPMEVVDRFGADAMRYTIVSRAALGTDIQLNYQDLEEAFRVGRNFGNKIWNAARLALSLLDEEDLARDPGAEELELADRWILSRFRGAAGDVTQALEAYRMHDVAGEGYRFVWGEFCDWYLELAKPRLHGDRGEESRRAAAATLGTVVQGWLRLLHPVMPFITEEIHTRLPGHDDEDTLMFGPWPRPAEERDDPEAEAVMDELQELVTSVRNLRGEYNVDPGQEVALRLSRISRETRAALEAEGDGIRRLARLSEIHVHGDDGEGDSREGEAGAHGVLRSGTELFVPLAEVLDLERERSRLEDEVERIDGLLRGSEKKLENEQFLEKAPEEVVEREREKHRSLQEQRERLLEKRSALSA
jgi:valyl-tRNA synthetase